MGPRQIVSSHASREYSFSLQISAKTIDVITKLIVTTEVLSLHGTRTVKRAHLVSVSFL